ncbi:MAG: hypothetical protein AAFQ92_08130 [Bacteroidota bacterium]
MKILPYTEANVKIVQEFLDETKERISNGATITFTKKSQDELTLLNIDHDITIEDIEAAIFHLTPSNYLILPRVPILMSVLFIQK